MERQALLRGLCQTLDLTESQSELLLELGLEGHVEEDPKHDADFDALIERGFLHPLARPLGLHERWTGLEHMPNWILLFIRTGEIKLLEHGAVAPPSPLIAEGWSLIQQANTIEQPHRVSTETFLKHLVSTEARQMLDRAGRWDWALAWWLTEAAHFGGDMGLDLSLLIRFAYSPKEHAGARAFKWRRCDAEAYRAGPFSPYDVVAGRVQSIGLLHHLAPITPPQ